MWGQIVQEVEEGPLYLPVLPPKREVNFSLLAVWLLQPETFRWIAENKEGLTGK